MCVLCSQKQTPASYGAGWPPPVARGLRGGRPPGAVRAAQGLPAAHLPWLLGVWRPKGGAAHLVSNTFACGVCVGGTTAGPLAAVWWPRRSHAAGTNWYLRAWRGVASANLSSPHHALAYFAQAALLLPWRRVFNLNDSQLFVARRDNARDIFAAKLAHAHGGELPADRRARATVSFAATAAQLRRATCTTVMQAYRFDGPRRAAHAPPARRRSLRHPPPAATSAPSRGALRELREYQQAVRLMDDTAEEQARTASAHVGGGCKQQCDLGLASG